MSTKRQAVLDEVADGILADRAAAEVAQQARDAEMARAAAQRADAVAAFKRLEEERLAAIGQAEKASRELVEALRRSLDKADVMNAVALGLGTAPLPLDARATERRLSHRLNAVLARLVAPRMVFGELAIGSSFERYRGPWVEAERRELAGYIATLEEPE